MLSARDAKIATTTQYERWADEAEQLLPAFMARIQDDVQKAIRDGKYTAKVYAMDPIPWHWYPETRNVAANLVDLAAAELRMLGYTVTAQPNSRTYYGDDQCPWLAVWWNGSR